MPTVLVKYAHCSRPESSQQECCLKPTCLLDLETRLRQLRLMPSSNLLQRHTYPSTEQVDVKGQDEQNVQLALPVRHAINLQV